MPDMAKKPPPGPVCLIECLLCKALVKNPIQFSDAKSFFSSMVDGSKMRCPNCRGMTDCNKDNMHFNDRHGNIVCGNDTIPEG